MTKPSARSVWTEMEIRVTYPNRPGVLSRVVRRLRRSGGRLLGHLIYELRDEAVGIFLCENPTDGAVALQEEDGVRVETETVVVARTERGRAAPSHLLETLEAEGVNIGYSYATGSDDEVWVVFRTDDNPRAEDVLRNYIVLPDTETADAPPS